MKYWINVVSRDHVLKGMAGGFTQANHGKPWALRKINKGDWLVFYSPKTDYQNGESLQAFTAICEIIDDEPYQVVMSSDFHPWRRNVHFEKVHETLIRPLIDGLDFIDNKTQWGYKFRFGVIEIGEHDFKLIKNSMMRQ
jgi:predicted RNA-binding protein